MTEAPYGTIHSTRTDRGIPIGGIGAGSFEIMTDGAVSHATVNNNWSSPTGDLNGCFAAVWTNAAGKLASRALLLKSAYGLPSAASVDYRGLYPQALIQFPDTSLPVMVSLRAFSPLVPQDLSASTLPVILFVFTIRNEARAPVDASIALSWENLIGVGGTAAKGAFADRTGNRIAPLPQTDGTFGLRMSGPPKPAVDPPDRSYYNAQGNYSLLAQPSTPDARVTAASWNALDKKPEWWDGFTRNGEVNGTVPNGKEGSIHPAGVVAVRVGLKAAETRELAFAVAWYTPRLYTSSGAEYGHFYHKMFDDSAEIGRIALQNRLSYASLTDEWQNRLLRSTLPPWLTIRLINDASVLSSSTIYTENSGLAGASPGPPLFMVVQTGSASNRTSTLVNRMFVHRLISFMFPVQDRRELEQIASLQTQDGSIPGQDERLDVVSGTPSTRPQSRDSAVSSSASFAFQVAQYYSWTGDRPFLDKLYPAAKHALEFAAGAVSAKAGQSSDEAVIGIVRGSLAAARQMIAAMNDRAFQESCLSMLRSIKPPVDSEARIIERWMSESVESADPGAVMSPITLDPPDTPAPARTASDKTLTKAAMAICIADLLARRGDLIGALAAARKTVTLVDDRPSTANQLANPPPEALLPNRSGRLDSSALWNLLEDFGGCRYDYASGRLTLAPPGSRSTRPQVAPVFMPSYWLTIEYQSSPFRTHIQVRMDRSMPVAIRSSVSRRSNDAQARSSSAAGLPIREIILPAPADNLSRLTVILSLAPVTGRTEPAGEGRLRFIPDTPIVLATGQRLEFLFRPE